MILIEILLNLMLTIFSIIPIAIIVVIIIAIIKKTSIKIPWDENTKYETQKPKIIDYTHSYQRKFLLTAFEHKEYKILKAAADRYDLLICPKVRLLDLIEPKHYRPNYKTLLYKVQSKHVDFVLCDKELNVKAIIELDDPSHKRPDRIERDKFVDQILGSVGYTIIHVQTIQPNIIEVINNIENNK